MRTGFAALLGRPNVGKSTLLNRLVGEKVSIVSHKPQTTRTRILGVMTRPEAQVAFFDTPGVHEAKDPLNQAMVRTALDTASECDVVLMMVDAGGLRADRPVEIGPSDRAVLEHLPRLGKPTFLLINKTDRVEKALVLPCIDAYQKAFPFAEILPISATTGSGVDALFRLVAERLPEGELMFPPDVFTDQAERTIVGEYVREQVLRKCRQEVPYATAVIVEQFDESERGEPAAPGAGRRRGLVRIDATIVVERESQKAIVIGKRGAMLKAIGTDAREAIARLLAANVYLGLHVKVDPRWSERPEALARLGYDPRPASARARRAR